MNSSSLGLFPWQLPLKRSNFTPELFGSPSYPSPLDRIRGRKVRSSCRTVKKKSQDQNGGIQASSFENNQSLPADPKLRLEKLDFLTRNEHSFCFSPGFTKGSFRIPPTESLLGASGDGTSSFNDSWLHRSYIGPASGNLDPIFQTSVVNPNKAIITIDQDGKILTVNDMAALLLGYDDFSSLNFDDLLYREKGVEALAENEILQDGTSILISGQVVELQCNDGGITPFSLWMKEINGNRRIAVLELVDRTVAEIVFCPETGSILDHDEKAELIFQSENLDGKPISRFLPYLELPPLKELKTTVKVKTTGRTWDEISFPAALSLSPTEGGIHLVVWVFSNLSGLLVISEQGEIESCNSNFTSLLFGYNGEELRGTRIEELIPGFFEDLELLNYSSSMAPIKIALDEDDEEDLGCESLDHDDADDEHEDDDDDVVVVGFKPKGSQNSSGEEDEDGTFEALKHLTSTPAASGCSKYYLNYRSHGRFDFPEGSFFGLGTHKNGSELPILYQIKRINLEDDSNLYCLWLSRDPEEAGEGGKKYGALTLASTFNNTADESLGYAIRRAVERRADKDRAVRKSLFEPSELCLGPYSEKYTTLQQIGKGGFGCVKLAYRKSDKLLVVTKFIKKSKVYEEYWITDKVLGTRISLEISLLTTLDHPNIVNAIDVFENENYFQMVMAKHGPGMDLFEFLDRNPKMDEPLACYIFQQVVFAVDYLHARGILHRDIKDENIIIDEKFHIKLIDFGSATFMKPGWLFSTFYGTVEYCSPEVLEGYHYSGPELEMWSLGVLLYIIMFRAYPFYNIDETIHCFIQPPFAVSPPCIQLIKSILMKDPSIRYTLPQIMDHYWFKQEVDITKYKFGDVIPCSDEELNPLKYFPDDKAKKSDDDQDSGTCSHDTFPLEH